jgi:hypothetical protein
MNSSAACTAWTYTRASFPQPVPVSVVPDDNFFSPGLTVSATSWIYIDSKAKCDHNRVEKGKRRLVSLISLLSLLSLISLISLLSLLSLFTHFYLAKKG